MNHASMREQGHVYCLAGPLTARNKISSRREAKIRAFTPGCGTPKPPDNKEVIRKYNNNSKRDKSRE